MGKFNIYKGHLDIFNSKIYAKGGKVFWKLKAEETAATVKIKLLCGKYAEDDTLVVAWESIPALVMNMDAAIIPRSLCTLIELSGDGDLPDHVQIQDTGMLFYSKVGSRSKLSVKHGRLKYKLYFRLDYGEGVCSLDLGWAIPDKVAKALKVVEELADSLMDMALASNSPFLKELPRRGDA